MGPDGEEACVYLQGLIPIRDGALAQPREDCGIIAYNAGSDRVEVPENSLEGDLFSDGSASAAKLPDLRRAAWSLVQMDGEGRRGVTIEGVVPFGLPQTSQAAEYCGALARAVYGSDAARLFSDCLGVVRHLTGTVASAMRPGLRYGGIVRGIRGHMRGDIHVEKVLAHQVLEGIVDPVERKKAQGNDWADGSAKAALLRHPPVGDYGGHLADLEADAAVACRVLAATSLLFLPSAWASSSPTSCRG